LKHLVNYILAPPFRDEQVSRSASGRVVFQLRRARHEGTEEVIFTPFEFLDRLAALVPRPNANTVRYFGIYASNAKLRKQAVGLNVKETSCAASPELGMVCPVCRARLRVIAAVGPQRRQRRDGCIAPDTPGVVTPHVQDRRVEVWSGSVQGRLFAEGRN
jgi:hypothetical protein